MTVPMISDQLFAEFIRRAEEISGVDRDVYEACAKNPLEPIIGLGSPDCRVGFFGRDPGKDEVRLGMPFIGAGGQKVRRALYSHLYGSEMPDLEASIAVGEGFFWANTVPYKPLGNKAWSMKVKKSFQPLMAELLIKNWQGVDMITLGREAFLWFGINQPREVRQQLEQFWATDDRFVTVCESEICLEDGSRKTFRIHPLPHPSPLNATWYKRFPDLLLARLEALKVTENTLSL